MKDKPPADCVQKLPRLSLRVDEVAECLGVGTSTIRRWAREGKIRAIRAGDTPRSPLLFLLTDIQEFLDRCPTVNGGGAA